MNKIYRTLWNKTTQSSVVVSELAKSGGKKSSAKTSLVNAAGNITLTASLLILRQAIHINSLIQKAIIVFSIK